MEERERARRAKESLKDRLRGVAEVVGIGLTSFKGRYAIQVNLKGEPSSELVPEEIDGFKVIVKVVGSIRKQT